MGKRLTKLEVEGIFLRALEELKTDVEAEANQFLDSYKPSLDLEVAEHLFSVIMAKDALNAIIDDLAMISDKIINEEFSK
jgi:hypothetical protein